MVFLSYFFFFLSVLTLFLHPRAFVACLPRAGLLMTGACLVGGLVAFRQGKQELSNQMQRGRVFFQFATVIAFLGGEAVSTLKPTSAPK